MGLDPSKTTCVNDAVTIQSTNAVTGPGNRAYGNLEMRYSASCHSNWVRYTGYTTFFGRLFAVTKHFDYFASPYIWRKGVDGTLQGEIGHSSLFTAGDSPTWWTGMVSADGETCSSVDIFANVPGATDYSPSEVYFEGHYEAPCAK